MKAFLANLLLYLGIWRSLHCIFDHEVMAYSIDFINKLIQVKDPYLITSILCPNIIKVHFKLPFCEQKIAIFTLL